jgi:pyridoxal phosphate enzyme (YggS family)
MAIIADSWYRIRERAAAAARRAGRDPDAIRIIAASKSQPVDAIAEAIEAGATDIGENYVQDAARKRPHLPASVRWHMIGHLQRNKAGRALELFDVIHTLDGVELGTTLARLGQQRNRVVQVLIEVNVAAESTKNGVAPETVSSLLAALKGNPWLQILGLMAVPPATEEAESARPYFRALRMLRDELAESAGRNAPLRELSMGMSDDFEVAIEEGATLVRLGRAIFGPRRPAA